MSDVKEYVGSLFTKRKAELVEIAEAMKLDEPEAKITDLIKNIHNHLENNDLKDTPMFKGLYSKRGRTHTEGPESEDNDITATVVSVAKRGRKSMNKALDSVQDMIAATNIPLPESPINVYVKIPVRADSSNRIQEVANDTVSRALVPAQTASRDLTVRLKPLNRSVMKFYNNQIHRTELVVRTVQTTLSESENLIALSLGLELIFLFAHVSQWYNHTIFFPPAQGEKGTIPTLLHALFFWAPKTTFTVRLPEMFNLDAMSHLWSAIAWWFSATVLPALAGSTLVSFLPPKGVSHNHRTRYAAPTPDPLSFSLLRLALLILPLTTAAPSAMVDALEMSGNPQGRALAAGVVAALTFANRLHG